VANSSILKFIYVSFHLTSNNIRDIPKTLTVTYDLHHWAIQLWAYVRNWFISKLRYKKFIF